MSVVYPELIPWTAFLGRRFGPASGREDRDGIPVYRERAVALVSPRLSVWPYRSYLAAAERGLLKVMAEQGKPDLIHAHVVLYAGWAAVQLGRRYSIPVVLTEHSSPFGMHLASRISRELSREALLGADAVVAVSPSLADQIRAFCDAVKVTVIGELVRTQFFTPSGSARATSGAHSTTLFLTVALLSEQKGIPHLLESARLLLERGHRAFRVVIGGDGPTRNAMEVLAGSLGVSEYVEFLGLLTPEAVRLRMQECDAFVLPSNHETFGIVLGEAMACGKPVIATRCGGPEYVVTPETGILVDVADPGALADAMEQFVLRRVAFNAGRIRDTVSRRFGEAAFVQNMTAVYQEAWLNSQLRASSAA